MPGMNPAPADWTALSDAVSPFGWTAEGARREFRKIGLIDRRGTPTPKLVEHGFVRQAKNRWQWNRKLLQGLLDELGLARLTSIEHNAWRAVQEFLSNIQRHRKAVAAGRDDNPGSLYLVAASSALMSAKPAKDDPLRMEKLVALSREMHLAGFEDSFQETLWQTLREDGGVIMSLAREAHLLQSTSGVHHTRARPRL